MVDDVQPTVSRQPVHEGRTGALATLALGARVGKYEILGVLGQGGFGITYRARDTQLDRDVAVKEYLPTAFAVRDPDSVVLPRSTQVAEDFRWGRDRFLAEAKTLARFEKTTSVVNVHDFLEANGTAYMVMGLITGVTLEVRLKRDGPLSQRAIEQFLQPLLDGLEQVHAADFLHRDVKPANILIDEKGQPTLIDFGASRAALQGRTQALTAVYTPGYAAFEQFTSARQGPWTDIYALGATLYHCITGAIPPSASDRMIDDRLVPAAEAGEGNYAPAFLDAIDAALKLKPAERPQSIGAWRRLLLGPAPSMPKEPGATPTRRVGNDAAGQPVPGRTRRRWPLNLAAAVLVLCLGGGGYLWWRGAQESEAWSRATAAGTDAAYGDYLAAYPQGRHAEAARQAIADLEARRQDAARRADEEMWAAAKAANTTPAYRTYLAAWPTGRFAAAANKAIADLEADEQAWARAAAVHTEESYGDYLKAWPSGVRAAEARKAIADLETRRLEAARRAEDEAWARAREANEFPVLRAYLERYPSGRYAAEARTLIADIEHAEKEKAARRVEDEAWIVAKAANAKASLQAYLDTYPLGRYAAETRGMVAALDRAEDETWARARSENSVAALRAYLDAYPSGRYAAEARQSLERAEQQAAALRTEDEAWTAAKATNAAAALRAYLERYPSGRYAAEARDRIEAIEREPQTRDCAQCPEMVRVPAGSFMMGSPASEAERFSDEGPQHRVAISDAFSLGKYEVTRHEFEAFVQATGRQTGNSCSVLGANGRWSDVQGKGWRDPGLKQTDGDPVVCVNWDDAKAYVAWLIQATGKKYRLPSESEWEYAARAGTTTARYWGGRRQDACQYANVDDGSHGCRDGYEWTAPVGRFQPNGFGLYDMIGNAWEWTEDCGTESYSGAPSDGSAWLRGDCSRRTLRGGSWGSVPGSARAAVRYWSSAGVRSGNFGFRVARTD